jgi:hypothetical protein
VFSSFSVGAVVYLCCACVRICLLGVFWLSIISHIYAYCVYIWSVVADGCVAAVG